MADALPPDHRMKTYPEMNERIIGILRTGGSYTKLYAAARIEELETEVREMREYIDAAVTNLNKARLMLKKGEGLKMSDPLSPERLAWIKQEAARCRGSCACHDDLGVLIAEIERLQEELRSIAQEEP